MNWPKNLPGGLSSYGRTMMPVNHPVPIISLVYFVQPFSLLLDLHCIRTQRDHNPKSQIPTISSTFFQIPSLKNGVHKIRPFLEGNIGKTQKKKFQKFLLSQIVRQVIPINYIPIKAILSTLVSWKNAKNQQKQPFYADI